MLGRRAWALCTKSLKTHLEWTVAQLDKGSRVPTRALGCLIFDARFPMPSWHLHTTKERRPQTTKTSRY